MHRYPPAGASPGTPRRLRHHPRRQAPPTHDPFRCHAGSPKTGMTCPTLLDLRVTRSVLLCLVVWCLSCPVEYLGPKWRRVSFGRVPGRGSHVKCLPSPFYGFMTRSIRVGPGPASPIVLIHVVSPYHVGGSKDPYVPTYDKIESVSIVTSIFCCVDNVVFPTPLTPLCS